MGTKLQVLSNKETPIERPKDWRPPRVTLARNPVLVAKWGISSGLLCPPIGLAYIAGSLRSRGYPVSIVDPVGESPFEVHPVEGRPLVTYGWTHEKTVAAMPEDTRYVGLSCMFSQEWPLFKALARQVRARFPDAIIVAGGEHVTAAPEFCLNDCSVLDYAAFGEGEETMCELLDALEFGGDLSTIQGIVFRGEEGIVRNERRQRIREVDAIPEPAWDLTPIESYLDNGLHYGVGSGRTMPMVATRGCPFQCTFCSSPNMWTTRWSTRDPKAVADELQGYSEKYGAKNFDFYDLTAIVRKDWIVKFCNELISRDLNITWQMPAGTRSEAIDDEVAELLARSGHRNLVYAPESGSPRMLKLIKKQIKVPRMLESMKASIDNGISVKLNMIVGFPDETWNDAAETFKFLMQCAVIGVDDVTFAIFSPYPGSELFDRLHAEGKIDNLNDEFYYGLATREDVKEVISYCENLGPRALRTYKLASYMAFYSLRFASRPQRIAATLHNLYKGEHETRLEKALSSVFDKVRRKPSAGLQANPA